MFLFGNVLKIAIYNDPQPEVYRVLSNSPNLSAVTNTFKGTTVLRIKSVSTERLGPASLALASSAS